MVKVTGEDWRECATNVELQRWLLGECLNAGVVFKGLEQMETTLCDFNSMCGGRFYVGADIDTQMVHLKDASKGLWKARAAFPDEYRGEKGGWVGPRKELKTLYRDKRMLVL
jgi:hypothetical protein